MSIGRQSQFLSAAHEILSKAGRPMHYTQIASAAKRLGILESRSQTAEVAMSSLLSEDIRKNPNSRFVRKRPGVYSLAASEAPARPNSTTETAASESHLDQLRCRTGLRDVSALLRKALYLTGRTIDVAQGTGVSVYSTLDWSQHIEVRIPDLVQEFHGEHDQQPVTWLPMLRSEVLRSLADTGNRLRTEHPLVTAQVAMFLLDLALDLIDNETRLLIHSGNTSITVSVRSIHWNACTKK